MYKIGSQNLISWIDSYKIDTTKVRIDYYQLNFIFKIEIKRLELYSINYFFIKFEVLSWIITKDFFGFTGCLALELRLPWLTWVPSHCVGMDLKHEPHDGKVRDKSLSNISH